MASEDNPVIVQEEDTGNFGLYHPEEDVIETYVGNDREEIPGAYVDVNWHQTEEEDLQRSIKADIEDVREQINDLRSRDLSDEQERELERLDSRLDSQENVLNLVEEVGDA